MSATNSLRSLSERPSVADLVERAKALVPSLRERANRIAELRTQPADVIQDLRDAGLMELMRPRRFGGHEFGMEAISRVGCALANGDGSTAWVYMVTGSHDAFLTLFPEKVQAEYWASENSVGASSYVPTGKVAPTDGGYILSGTWSFCSGIDVAGWVTLGAVVGMLENPTRPDMRFFLVPSSQYEIVDDWHVVGLRGTGSKSVTLNSVFVPSERMIQADQIVEGAALSPGSEVDSEYKESIWVGVGVSLAGPAAGIARAAYDNVVSDLQKRFERSDPFFLAKQVAVHMQLAEASIHVEHSETLLQGWMDRTFAKIAAAQRLTDAERARDRRDIAYSVIAAKKAIDLVMRMSGGSGLRETHPAQRALRDVYAIAAHPGIAWDSPAMSFGSVALGGVPTERHI